MADPRPKTTNNATLELTDLWSRPGPWARQRAIIFLIVNVCVFAALNTLVFWIQNARLFDFGWSSYAETYHKTLIDLLTFPISVDEAPVMIPIVGMLLGVIIVVPILISQLYGFRFSILFTACVFVFAHLPVLSLFLLACSFIAGTSRRWLAFKFGVAILSLLPIAVYFYIATRGAETLKPIDSTLLYAPWVLAFIAAAGIAAAVLAFAKFVKYRPGGILISMIPFFAVPGLLFRHYIGADQLEFRLLAHRCAYESRVPYAATDIAEAVFQQTLNDWRRTRIRNVQAIADLAESKFPFVAQQLTQQTRRRIIQACIRFRHEYPRSRFVPNQLYIQALAEDMRPDYQVLTDDWRLEYHTELVSPQSRTLWQELVERFPDSIYAQPARLRLATILARQGQIDKATALLNELIARAFPQHNAAQTRPSSLSPLTQVFAKPEQVDIPHVDLASIQQQAHRLHELIHYNADDDRFGTAPLTQFLTLDKRHPKLRMHLLDLATRYSGGKLHDNLLVRYALTEPDPERQEVLLTQYAHRFRGHDAGALALFELGRLTKSLALCNMDADRNRTARTMFLELIQQYPNSYLSKQAEQELATANLQIGALRKHPLNLK